MTWGRAPACSSNASPPASSTKRSKSYEEQHPHRHRRRPLGRVHRTWGPCGGWGSTSSFYGCNDLSFTNKERKMGNVLLSQRLISFFNSLLGQKLCVTLQLALEIVSRGIYSMEQCCYAGAISQVCQQHIHTRKQLCLRVSLEYSKRFAHLFVRAYNLAVVDHLLDLGRVLPVDGASDGEASS